LILPILPGMDPIAAVGSATSIATSISTIQNLLGLTHEFEYLDKNYSVRTLEDMLTHILHILHSILDRFDPASPDVIGMMHGYSRP